VDQAERLAAAAAGVTIRPLVVEQDLGVITHLMLPEGVAPPPPQAQRYLRDLAETARTVVRQSLIASSAGGDAAAVLAAIGTIGDRLADLYETEFARQRAIDPTFTRALAGVACRKGCSFCCRLEVSVTPLEVIRIAAAIDEERGSSVLSTADIAAGLSKRERL